MRIQNIIFVCWSNHLATAATSYVYCVMFWFRFGFLFYALLLSNFVTRLTLQSNRSIKWNAGSHIDILGVHIHCYSLYGRAWILCYNIYDVQSSKQYYEPVSRGKSLVSIPFHTIKLLHSLNFTFNLIINIIQNWFHHFFPFFIRWFSPRKSMYNTDNYFFFHSNNFFFASYFPLCDWRWVQLYILELVSVLCAFSSRTLHTSKFLILWACNCCVRFIQLIGVKARVSLTRMQISM